MKWKLAFIWRPLELLEKELDIQIQQKNWQYKNLVGYFDSNKPPFSDLCR